MKPNKKAVYLAGFAITTVTAFLSGNPDHTISAAIVLLWMGLAE